MKTKIDLKSALCGLTVGLLAMFVIGAADLSSNPVGRYQGASGQNLLLIVDTATGKAWGLQPGNVTLSGSPSGFFDEKVGK